MKSGFIFCMLLTFLFTSCSFIKYQKVEYVGIAQNAKSGAILYVPETDSVYYIANKKQWGVRRLDTKIKVTGRLEYWVNQDYKNDSIKVGQIARKKIIHFSRCRIINE